VNKKVPIKLELGMSRRSHVDKTVETDNASFMANIGLK